MQWQKDLEKLWWFWQKMLMKAEQSHSQIEHKVFIHFRQIYLYCFYTVFLPTGIHALSESPRCVMSYSLKWCWLGMHVPKYRRESGRGLDTRPSAFVKKRIEIWHWRSRASYHIASILIWNMRVLSRNSGLQFALCSLRYSSTSSNIWSGTPNWSV